MRNSLAVFLTIACVTPGCTQAVKRSDATGEGAPRVVLTRTTTMTLPGAADQANAGQVDCNSPVHWDGDTMYVFSSTGHPYRSSGPNLADLRRTAEKCHYDNEAPGGRWIEATYRADDGKLYGWYHLEPHPVCNSPRLTAPQIGAVVSKDNGLHWHDLGIILTAPEDSMFCETANYYFSGGNGDFCVMLDQQRKDYFYFLISTYNRDVTEQGVAVARMRYSDRDQPVGKVFKWHDGQWKEPGLGGHVTPFFGVGIDWHKPDADALWGPSVHWNSHLRQYVMLLNRARDKNWAQEGIYVSFNRDLANPNGWSAPEKILDAADLERSKWYPQFIGTAKGETDKLAGPRARLFVAGVSNWEATFLRAGEPAPEAWATRQP